MLPGVEANKKAATANRELLESVVEMQAAQNDSLVTVVEAMANSFNALAAELRSRNEQTIKLLEAKADRLEADAKKMSRQRAAGVLNTAAADIRQAAVRLRGGKNNVE